uniref:Putative secreted protein n=1 Tax=Anopheles triannulatus TaxID=58253 RepID=A0A2M4B632_9DIPT
MLLKLCFGKLLKRCHALYVTFRPIPTARSPDEHQTIVTTVMVRHVLPVLYVTALDDELTVQHRSRRFARHATTAGR